jgi:hypothetical protein
MHPKQKLIMLILATVFVIGMLVFAIVQHNWLGLWIDIGILVYYIPHYIFTIQDLKKLQK